MSKSNVPESIAFVKPLLARSSEIKAAQPVVSYYLKLQAVEKVLTTKLHLQDEAVATIAGDLMTEIEAQRKVPEVAEIIEDEAASEATVMNFANNVFEKAQRDLETGQATKATGAGFMASVTFLGLEEMWGDLSEDTKERIKYAKVHAARILRAVKNGEDPNVKLNQAEDDLDTGVEQDAQDLSLAKDVDGIAIDGPAEPSPEHENDEADQLDAESEPSLPSAPHELPACQDDLELPAAPSSVPNELGLPVVPERKPSIPFDYDRAPRVPDVKEFEEPSAPPKPPAKPVAPVPTKPKATGRVASIDQVVEEAKIFSDSQKHARYAISALNYEDVDAAVAELKKALAILENYSR